MFWSKKDFLWMAHFMHNFLKFVFTFFQVTLNISIWKHLEWLDALRIQIPPHVFLKSLMFSSLHFPSKHANSNEITILASRNHLCILLWSILESVLSNSQYGGKELSWNRWERQKGERGRERKEGRESFGILMKFSQIANLIKQLQPTLGFYWTVTTW